MGAVSPMKLSLAEVPAVAIGEGQGAIQRIVTKRRTGSETLFGVYNLEPGDRCVFALPGSSGIPREEIYFVLEGRVAITYDSTSIVLESEDAIHLPSGFQYTVQVDGAVRARIAYVASPAPE